MRGSTAIAPPEAFALKTLAASATVSWTNGGSDTGTNLNAAGVFTAQVPCTQVKPIACCDLPVFRGYTTAAFNGTWAGTLERTQSVMLSSRVRSSAPSQSLTQQTSSWPPVESDQPEREWQFYRASQLHAGQAPRLLLTQMISSTFDNAPRFSQSDMVARPSYMLSFLAIQAARLQATFAQRHGGAWLIWEPGQWLPPSRALMETMGASKKPEIKSKPTDTDALCFSLGDARVIRVGRAPDNDCVISDATVSRYHAELSRLADGWVVRSVAAKGLEHNGSLLTEERPLSSFDQLKLGHVVLTFASSVDALSRRLKAQLLPPRA